MENCWLLIEIMSTASIYINLDLCKGAIAIELYTRYEPLLLQFNNFASFLVIIHRTITTRHLKTFQGNWWLQHSGRFSLSVIFYRI